MRKGGEKAWRIGEVSPGASGGSNRSRWVRGGANRIHLRVYFPPSALLGAGFRLMYVIKPIITQRWREPQCEGGARK